MVEKGKHEESEGARVGSTFAGQNSIDGEECEGEGVLADNLAVEGDGGGLDEGVVVGEVERDGHAMEDVDDVDGDDVEGIEDNDGVYADEEEGPGEDDEGGGVVINIGMLEAREVDRHFGENLEIEDGSTVVGNDDLAKDGGYYFIHVLEAEASLQGVHHHADGDECRHTACCRYGSPSSKRSHRPRGVGAMMTAAMGAREGRGGESERNLRRKDYSRTLITGRRVRGKKSSMCRLLVGLVYH